MKKLMTTVLLSMLLISPAMAAFEIDVVVLEKKEILKLSDEELLDKYLDTIVEVEASKAFHTTSGFSPKDYKAYKALIKFRLLILMEIHSRNLEIPQLER